MNDCYTTGNQIVDAMAKIRITGNIVNPNWFKTILYENGKPNLNAIVILSDIVYWHRPTEIRDEETGEQIGLKKKFSGASFHRSYKQFHKQFGLTKRQVQLALQALEDLGVIRRKYCTVEANGQTEYNAMFIDLVPSVLQELTNPPERVTTSMSLPNHTDVMTSLHKKDYPITQRTQGSDVDVMTNTYIKEINKDYVPILSYQELKEDFKNQIEYDVIVTDHPYEKESLDGIVELAVEVLASKKKTLRVNQENVPLHLVQERMRKLDMFDVEYVMDCISNSGTKARNIKALLLTSLYNAKMYRSLYMTNWVSSDMHKQIKKEEGEL